MRMAIWCDHGRAIAMIPNAYRITRVEKTLRRFEEDIPMLNLRVKELSVERQRSARQFASALISQTRAELHRLREEQPKHSSESDDDPCEPAD
jgi:hypothetical protein